MTCVANDEEQYNSYIAGKNVKWCTLESLAVPQKPKHRINNMIQQFQFLVYTQEKWKNNVHTEICTQIFTTVSLMIAKMYIRWTNKIMVYTYGEVSFNQEKEYQYKWQLGWISKTSY